MPKLERLSSARLPTPYGEFQSYTYSAGGNTSVAADTEQTEHLVCVLGTDRLNKAPPLLRIHSECLTGDVLGSLRCDCGEQLHRALEMMSKAGVGILIYLRGQEGRGIGITHKLRAYELQDDGHDTVDANIIQGFPIDIRSYEAAADILKDLGVAQVQLMTNNPAKLELEKYGIEILNRIPLESSPTAENLDYLRTKRDRLGHLLTDLS